MNYFSLIVDYIRGTVSFCTLIFCEVFNIKPHTAADIALLHPIDCSHELQYSQ
jgi:hypothetical protein